ncbi:MAG TPA: cobyric acid synthase, partial [Bryobacteraceae bacterium]|nr:cobyric acid synthase [Bryobacteraceae bacterium]
SSQVVLLGKVWGHVGASDYHMRRVEDLFPVVLESYQSLAARYSLILLEGAGSPAEINLREHDIVNMRMARAAGAVCLLVGDIDRGGVFASLLGTLQLLDPEERALIRGYVINKFRGDESLLRPGIEMMNGRLGIPCAGVVPYLPDLGLDEEDGVALEDRRSASRLWREPRGIEPGRPLRIGVVPFPYMANFTDFDSLAAEPEVSLAFLDDPSYIVAADVLILPGSKQTLDDLAWLRHSRYADPICRHSGPVLGICGGFQMLGRTIEDPHGVESEGAPRTTEGLSLLPLRTVLRKEKTTRRVQGIALRWPGPCFQGYEIHMGETFLDPHSSLEPHASSFAEILREGSPLTLADGAVDATGRVCGTYVHGLFDQDAFRHSFVTAMRAACGLAPAALFAQAGAEREARINRWADHLRRSLDLKMIRSWMGDPA